MSDRIIDPLSHYNLPVTVRDPSDNTPIEDATVVATIVGPSRTKIASEIPCTYSGSGGIYLVPLVPEYSLDDAGNVREGQYYAEIVAVATLSARLVQRAVRAYYTVQFSAS